MAKAVQERQEQQQELLTFKELKDGDCVEALVHGHVTRTSLGQYTRNPYPGYCVPGVKYRIIRPSPSMQGIVNKCLVGGHINSVLEFRDEKVARRLSAEERTSFLEELEEAKDKQFLKEGPGYCAGHSTGSDPEVFALNEGGEVIPAFAFLPSKEKRGAGMPFWDGFQAEFNPNPATCLQNLQGNIKNRLVELHNALHAYDPKARLSARSVVEVDPEVLRILPDEHVALGCSASLNVYPDVEPLEVLNPRALLYRSAGCHIHFGVGQQTEEQVREQVKALDAIAGVTMVSLFEGLEDPRRRILYGRAGEHRLPLHGLEYRVPPAEVLCHPAIYMLCFDLCRQARGVGLRGYLKHWKAEEKETREIINSCDWKQARVVMKRNKAVLLKIFGSASNHNPVTVENFEKLAFNGARQFLPVDDMEGLWRLKPNDPEIYPTDRWEMRTLKAETTIKPEKRSYRLSANALNAG